MKYGDWYKTPDDMSNQPDDLYTALWTRFGGKPFTYRLRDFWHKHIKTIIWLFILAGVADFFFGSVFGHLFWRD